MRLIILARPTKWLLTLFFFVFFFFQSRNIMQIFRGSLKFTCGIIIFQTTSVFDVCFWFLVFGGFLPKNYLLYRIMVSKLNGVMDLLCKNSQQFNFFALGFLMQTLMIHSITVKGRDPSLFLFNISTFSRTFRYFFVVLRRTHVNTRLYIRRFIFLWKLAISYRLLKLCETYYSHFPQRGGGFEHTSTTSYYYKKNY